uniref:Exodeoxyribonuclease 7 small subunit n=1 Tax=Chlorobium chlorochromatii (strain CaD3) TaxID=340177 RepID=Q3APF3_CHLCH
MTSSQPNEPSLEELLQRLDEITHTLENPDTGIERSIKLYEQGLLIAERCRKRLEYARSKIEKLKPNSSSSLPQFPLTDDLFN